MEPALPSFPLFVSFSLLLLLLFSIRNKSKTQNPSARLPPGPWQLPLVGSLHHLVGTLPHHALHRLAKRFGPVMYLKLGQVDQVVLSSAETAREIMKTNELNFASRPELLLSKIVCYGGTDVAFSPHGNYWRQLRKICVLELLSAKRVKTFRSLREEEVSNLVRHISSENGSPVNLTDKFLSLANVLTAKAGFGDKCRQQERFIANIKEGIQLVSGFSVADLYPSLEIVDVLTGMKSKLERIHRQLDDILNEIVEEHQQKSATKTTARDDDHDDELKEDLLDVLLRVKDHGDLEIPLTLDNIKAVMLDMFTGGTETSATTMEWAMAELIRNPKVMDKAQAEARQVLKGKAKIEEGDIAELHYLKLVIKETLRLHPPFPLLRPRVCSETCEVGGYTIPAGSRVVINAWAMGRDPGYWEDPESFKPERFDGSSVDFKGANFEYLPFGGGRRICPGMGFGLANVELPLAQLLYYFDWQLPDGMSPQDLDMAETFGVAVGRKSELFLLATPSVPLGATQE